MSEITIYTDETEIGKDRPAYVVKASGRPTIDQIAGLLEEIAASVRAKATNLEDSRG